MSGSRLDVQKKTRFDMAWERCFGGSDANDEKKNEESYDVAVVV